MERLELRLAEINKIKVRITTQVLSVNALFYVVLLICSKGNVDTANKVFTSSIQYQAVAWTCWFMLPYFLRMEAKSDVSLAMGHDSVDILGRVDSALEERFERIDRLLEKTEKFTSRLNEEGLKTLEEKADKFLQELRYIRLEISKTGTGVRQGMEDAMNEGEVVAALVRGEAVSCPKVETHAMELRPGLSVYEAYCKSCEEGHHEPS